MVSIISALYKSERYLARYLLRARSFAKYLSEKRFPFEIIIVPTRPSPNELVLLEAVKNEPWCKILPFDELGLYKAWNVGFTFARGDIMGPWNVDDIRFPSAIIEAQELADRGADVVYFPFTLKRYITLGPISFPLITRKVEGEVLHFEKRKFETTMTAGPHFMFSKRAYKNTGPFDEQFKIAGDFDWCARAAAMDLKFSLAKEFSGVFRVDGKGLSAGANRTLQAENNIIYLRHNAKEKISAGLETIMDSYQVGKLKINGQWQDINSF